MPEVPPHFIEVTCCQLTCAQSSRLREGREYRTAANMTPVPPGVIRLIEAADPLTAAEALQRAVDAGHASDAALVEAVFTRCKRGLHLNEDALVDWLVAASPASTSAFNLSWPRLRTSAPAILRLLAGLQYGRKQLEEAALAMLTKMGTTPAQPMRPKLLDALAGGGSHRCIPWLEELQRDYETSLDRKRSVGLAAPNALTMAEAGSMKEALASCQAALEGIRTRVADADVGSSGQGPMSRSAAMHLSEATELAAGTSPGRSLNALRHHLEAVCDALLDYWQLSPKTKEGGRPKLNEKLDALRVQIERHDKFMFALMCGINKLTDFGSHHSDDLLDKVASADVAPIVEISENLHRRFQQI